jgi:hypothetical protein
MALLILSRIDICLFVMASTLKSCTSHSKTSLGIGWSIPHTTPKVQTMYGGLYHVLTQYLMLARTFKYGVAFCPGREGSNAVSMPYLACVYAVPTPCLDVLPTPCVRCTNAMSRYCTNTMSMLHQRRVYSVPSLR